MIRVNSNIRAFRLRRRAKALTLSSSRRVLRTLIVIDEKAKPSVLTEGTVLGRGVAPVAMTAGLRDMKPSLICVNHPAPHEAVDRASTQRLRVQPMDQRGSVTKRRLWTNQVIHRLIHRLTNKLLTYNLALSMIQSQLDNETEELDMMHHTPPSYFFIPMVITIISLVYFGI